MMNVHMTFIHCAIRRFKSIGFQNALLQQRSKALYSGGSKSSSGMCFHSGLYLKIRTSRRHGTLDLLNHSLIKISNNFELSAIVQRSINTLAQNAPFGKLRLRASNQGIYSLIRFEVCTIALDGENDKTDVVDVACTPKYMDFYSGPERDLINFPRPVRREYPEKVRHAFIPESWFQSFYNKTGVTGPYTLLFTMMAFLISKEIYVLEHEFYSGVSVVIMCHYCVKNFGPLLAAYLDKMVDNCAENWEMQRKLDQKAYEEGIANERLSQFQSEGQMKLFEIKKQVVAIQLECEYRKRLWEAYNEVVQQLEKELMKHQVCKYIAQKNMQQWVLCKISEGLTPELELAVLKWALCRIQELACQHQSSSFPSAIGRQQESSIILACVSDNSGLGISPRGFHIICESTEKNHLDEGQIFPLLLQSPDSEDK